MSDFLTISLRPNAVTDCHDYSIKFSLFSSRAIKCIRFFFNFSFEPLKKLKWWPRRFTRCTLFPMPVWGSAVSRIKKQKYIIARCKFEVLQFFSLAFYVPNGKFKWPQISNFLKIFKVVVLDSYLNRSSPKNPIYSCNSFELS